MAAGWYGSLSLKSASGSLISAKCRLRRLRAYQPSSSPANWDVGRRSARRHPAGSATSSQRCSCPKPRRTGRGPRFRLVITAPCGHESPKSEVPRRLSGGARRRAAWADTTTPHGRLMLTVLGGLAEFERELILARTGAGRDRAKAQGVCFGRLPSLTPHQRREAMER